MVIMVIFIMVNDCDKNAVMVIFMIHMRTIRMVMVITVHHEPRKMATKRTGIT